MKSSERLVNSDNFLSENPIDFILLNSIKLLGMPLFIILFSFSIISLICFKNQGSIFDKLYIFSSLKFFLNASATRSILFGIFFFRFFSICSLLKLKILSSPENPVSKEIKAF